MMNQHSRSARWRPPGMTIVELLMALALTSVVTLAATGMLTAVSYGSSQRTDLRAMVVRQEVLAQRLSAAIRSSRAVLVCDDEQLLLWHRDANNDAQPQVSEVRWLKWDRVSGQITSTHLAFPLDWPEEQKEAMDRLCNPAQSSASQLAGLGSYVTQENWATQVAGWQLITREASEDAGGIVGFRVTLTDDHDQKQTIVGAAGLRSQ